MSKNNSRRSMIKSMAAATVASIGGLFGVANAKPTNANANKKVNNVKTQDNGVPLFSGAVIHNGLVYISGKGEHTDEDIKAHTKAVLDQIEEELENAGSSMEKVLKVNVYLHDLNDYDGMNEEYQGRFGSNPPVRTTVGCYAGIPGTSLVEIDAIAAQ